MENNLAFKYSSKNSSKKRGGVPWWAKRRKPKMGVWAVPWRVQGQNPIVVDHGAKLPEAKASSFNKIYQIQIFYARELA